MIYSFGLYFQFQTCIILSIILVYFIGQVIFVYTFLTIAVEWIEVERKISFTKPQLFYRSIKSGGGGRMLTCNAVLKTWVFGTWKAPIIFAYNSSCLLDLWLCGCFQGASKQNVPSNRKPRSVLQLNGENLIHLVTSLLTS